MNILTCKTDMLLSEMRNTITLLCKLQSLHRSETRHKEKWLLVPESHSVATGLRSVVPQRITAQRVLPAPCRDPRSGGLVGGSGGGGEEGGDQLLLEPPLHLLHTLVRSAAQRGTLHTSKEKVERER